VATDKTKLTELGTAVGLVYEPQDDTWPAAIENLDIPGLARDEWQPFVLPATRTADPQRGLLLRAITNGHDFRRTVLGGRRPRTIEWTGGGRTTWTSDIPRDLTVDGVYFIQAKYDSTCVLNTAPATMVDHLLVEDGAGQHASWFETVALRALQAYYTKVRTRCGLDQLPRDVRDLDRAGRDALKLAMRAPAAKPSADEDTAYLELCQAVSIETELRWKQRLRASTTPQHTQMLFRMLRIAGGPYWLLGTKRQAEVQLAVTDTRTWRDRFELKAFTVTAAHAGQPQVDWRATVRDRATREACHIEGICEIRWSHGKLQGHPECKVQVVTPLAALPGYDPMH
jgi:hypothetical protein